MILPFVLLIIAGVCEGFVEALKYRYPVVRARLGVSERWWNPSLSWLNKYRNGNPDHGARFWLSTTALVWLTDAYHFFNFAGNALLFAAFAFAVQLQLPGLWWLAAMPVAWGCYASGGAMVLEWWFKK